MLQREEYLELSKFDKLVGNLAVSMFATFLNAVILTGALWNVIQRERLVAWCAVNVTYVAIRYAVIAFYRKRFDRKRLVAWKIGTCVSFAVAGMLFGSSGVFLVDPANFECVLFVYFIAGGMAVGSVGSYHNYLPVYFIYSSTVFLIPTASLFFLDRDISSPMVVLGLVFYGIISLMAIRLSRDLRESILLRFDNARLADSLNAEKTNTERLNSELVAKNRELEELSLTDPLTALKNRRYLFDVVMPEIDSFIKTCWQERNGSNKRDVDLSKGYGVIIVDIDHFKSVNDTYGHDSGDLALVQFADRLRETVRGEDVIARFGGEEFIVVLKRIEERNSEEITEKLRKAVEGSPFGISGEKTLRLTCSLGLAFHPFRDYSDETFTFRRMIAVADRAMYHAKEHGRNASFKASAAHDGSFSIIKID